ncbi:uncharacterized protein LOC130630111 [Hydractinia symbiolongicarpus]|uniref:uncharacterized protein LOC130630111 n=1 Tax=Hydractinia symbiolongicarpus TaxID=13093 RepID=UPI002550899E|nr:uncharacterized protein LOC130630111 [Hydractinia symbiolongicarpus]
MIAIFWRAFVRVKQLKVEEETGFGMDIECRDMLGFTQSYFDNCVFPLGISLTVEKLMTIPLADVPGKIRVMTKSVDKKYLNSILNKMESTGNNRNVSSGINTVGNDFSLLSWSKFRLPDIDFGCGKPTNFKKLFGAYSRFHVWKSVDKKGFVVRVSLKDDQLKSFLADEEVQLLL